MGSQKWLAVLRRWLPVSPTLNWEIAPQQSYHMNPFISIIDTGKVPTPEGLYKVAVYIENAAAVANVLVGLSMSEGDKDSVCRSGTMTKAMSISCSLLTQEQDWNCPINGILSAWRVLTTRVCPDLCV